jgi:hypothetical protein
LKFSKLRLSVLSLSLFAAFSASAQTSDVNARIESLEKTVADLTSSAGKTSGDVGLPLHGFMDVAYANASSEKPAGAKTGFNLGVFDIYLAPQLGDRVKGLVELAFEYNDEGALGTDLERLQLGYTVNDNLTLWGGRFHTPYGYWNTAFHHGAQIQTSITRPRFINFEDGGGLLPAHTVGAWATGKVATGAGSLHYDVFAGNSDTMRDGVLDYNAAGVTETSPSAGFNLGISPVEGLTVGVHGLQEKIGIEAAGVQTGQVDLKMLGGYAFYESDKWEVIAEYYGFSNTDLFGSAGTNASTAGFVQAGFQVADRTTAFVRYEKADLSKVDPYFANASSYSQNTVGVRYDLDPRSALKLQVESINDDANNNNAVTWVRAQYSVRF